ncbi:MAG: hypothetical protein NTX47_05420 [Candidatus Omnitrophica bacterium]|nr:hypothetical protein [Candidatus Omnitrophota bacterium]
MDKVFYEIDPFNRLIVGNPPGRGSKVKKFRKVVYGRFGTDENNELFYEVNKSSGTDTPQKIKFSGKYFLDKDHNLVITLNKWNNQCEGNRLTLKTKIIDANNNEIAFLVNSKAGETESLVYVIKFYGSWQADEFNRLTFGIEGELKGMDSLVLCGAWEINKNNEIIYKCGKYDQALTFRGHWDISDKHRIRYTLDKKIGSGFSFKSSLGTLAPKGKYAYVTFDIGIGVSKAKRLVRKIIFSGKWKMGRGKELILETSGAEKGGLTLRFAKEMFDKRGSAYIESIFRDNEHFIGGGVAFRW